MTFSLKFFLISTISLIVFAGCDSDNSDDLTSDELSEEIDPVDKEYSHEAVLLTALGGEESNAWSINKDGIAAGWSSVNGGRAIHWANDFTADLTGKPSGSRGINKAGSIVGYFDQAGGRHAYVARDRNVIISLKPLNADDNTFAWGINNGGTVVGTSGGKAVVWNLKTDGEYDTPFNLHLFNNTERMRVNSRGDVTFRSAENGRPVLFIANSDGSYGEPLWLGVPGDGDYFVRGLNDTGIIVGSRATIDDTMAVVWLPGNYEQPIELGKGDAWDVNENNQIVGSSGGDLPLFGGEPRRPALWTIQEDRTITGPVDIGTPTGYASGGARAINDAGFIVGSSWQPFMIRATLWSPKK